MRRGETPLALASSQSELSNLFGAEEYKNIRKEEENGSLKWKCNMYLYRIEMRRESRYRPAGRQGHPFCPLLIPHYIRAHTYKRSARMAVFLLLFFFYSPSNITTMCVCVLYPTIFLFFAVDFSEFYFYLKKIYFSLLFKWKKKNGGKIIKMLASIL
jgi:hypothetical protein